MLTSATFLNTFLKTRTILLKIPNAYQRRMIPLSARKLKTFDEPVFLSRQLTKEEADRENQALMRRRELINDGTEPKNLRVVTEICSSGKAQNGSRRKHPKSTGPFDKPPSSTFLSTTPEVYSNMTDEPLSPMP